MSQVVNPTGQTNYYGTNGSAITSQPQNNTSRVGAASKNTSIATGLPAAGGLEEDQTLNRDMYPVTVLDTIDRVHVDDTVVSTPFTQIGFDSDNSKLDAISVGDLVLGGNGKIAKVKLVSSDSIDFYEPNVTGGGNTFFYTVDQNVLKQLRDGNFAAIGITDTLNESSNFGLFGGGNAGPIRGANTREAVRTTRTATAIRAGNWNEYDGVWTSDPAVADDTSDLMIASDNSTTTTSRTTFAYGHTPDTK